MVNIIGMMIRCSSISGTCLNISCDFILDFNGHSFCQTNLSWQHTRLIWEHSTMPWHVYMSSLAANHSHRCMWFVYYLLCSTDPSSQLFPPELSSRKYRALKWNMPWKSCLHKCSRAHIAVACTLASLKQLVCGQQGPPGAVTWSQYYLQTHCHRENIFARHVRYLLSSSVQLVVCVPCMPFWEHNQLGQLGHVRSIHSYGASQMLLEIFLSV